MRELCGDSSPQKLCRLLPPNARLCRSKCCCLAAHALCLGFPFLLSAGVSLSPDCFLLNFLLLDGLSSASTEGGRRPASPRAAPETARQPTFVASTKPNAEREPDEFRTPSRRALHDSRRGGDSAQFFQRLRRDGQELLGVNQKGPHRGRCVKGSGGGLCSSQERARVFLGREFDGFPLRLLDVQSLQRDRLSVRHCSSAPTKGGLFSW